MKEFFKEDLKNYNEIFDAFQKMYSEDGALAYDLAISALVNADRWNEIMVNASKYARECDCSKTDLYSYCYNKYRILSKIHEFCRVVFRNCNEEARSRMDSN